mmetsp:Transcript_41962/g.96316  ORF Transcript_41962/g.96316 Transcript_41962/m.96316 type:complete len:948 (-) Transcript_41962:35-2878(-)
MWLASSPLSAFIPGRFASVASSFLSEQQESERHAVQTLLDVAGLSLGTLFHFYSPPGACGRKQELLGHDASDYVLLASSDHSAPIGKAAPLEHRPALRKAATDSDEEPDGYLAIAVKDAFALHGLLLTTKSERDFSKAALQLFAAMLAERLEKMRWRAEAEVLRESLQSVLRTTEHLLEPNSWQSSWHMIGNMIPRQLLIDLAGFDRVALWFHDHAGNELVLNNSGELDGARVPVDKSIAGDSVASSSPKIVCVQDAYADSKFNRSLDDLTGVRTLSTLCVPIKWATGTERTVLQFTNCCLPDEAAEQKRPIDLFDVMTAEALQGFGGLPLMLQLRNRFLLLIQSERQRRGLQILAGHLIGAESVMEVVQSVETDVAEVLKCERSTMLFIDHNNGQLWSPPTEHKEQGVCLEMDDGLAGHVARVALQSTGTAPCIVIVNDPTSCPHWNGDFGDEDVTRNVMVAPIWSTEKDRHLLGLLQVENKEDTQGKESDRKSVGFTAQDERLMAKLAQAIGEHLQTLLLDMAWAKASMDEVALDDEDEEVAGEGGPAARPLLLQEYYTEQRLKRVCETVFRGSITAAGANLPKTPKAAEDLSEKNFFDNDAEPAPHCDIDNWEIDYWSLTGDEEFNMLLQGLRVCGSLAEMVSSRRTLFKFFSAVREEYHQDNAYHNWQHALSTMHFSCKMVRSAGLMQHLNRTDMLTLLIAALCHDCDHRGRNNNFEVTSRSELALRYNDSSVLENHHCARTFEIALQNGGDSQFNIFAGLSSEEFGRIRKLMIAGILSTDMIHHGEHVQLVLKFELQEEQTEQQSQFLIELVLHAADISNQLMPPASAARWGKAIAEEFTAQVEDEKLHGLPVTKFMDGLTNPAVAAKSQVGFIDFVVQPLFTPIFRLFPGLHPMRENLEENRKASSAIVEGARRQKAEAGELSSPPSSPVHARTPKSRLSG